MALPYFNAAQRSIIMWGRANADIPADFSRDTNFDDKFMSGANTADGTGGNVDTHQHTSNVHTHTTSHNHVLSISGDSQTLATANTSRIGLPASRHVHTHANGNTNSAAPTNQNTATTVFLTTTHVPLNFEVIFISPDDASQDIPDESIVFANRITVPDGFHVTDGNDGTVDMDNRFAKGAVAAGDGGGLLGNSSHTHSILSHDHTQNSHNHGDSLFAAASSSGAISGGSNFTYTDATHHTATSIQTVTANNQNGFETTASASNDPVYTKLLGLENTSGGDKTIFRNLVIGWTGDIGNVPQDWYKCDGSGDTLDLTACQIKVTASTGSVGDTGGANSHTHSGGAGHTHIQDAHDHTYVFGTNAAGTAGTGSAANWSPSNHTHNVDGDDLAAAVGVNDNTEVTMDTVDSRWAYREVIFIQYNPPTVHIKGGAILGGYIK